MKALTTRLVCPLVVFLLLPAGASAHHRGSDTGTFGLKVSSSDLPIGKLAATANGVALSSNAGCTNDADLDLSLTTVGATREVGITSLTDGTIMDQFEDATALANFDGTYVGYGLPIDEQPPGTVIGTYAYVGETPPSAGDTAEFFILYQCDTQEVLLSCFGPFGTCPQTADEAGVPTLPAATWLFLAVLLLLAGISRLRTSRPVTG
ncbi:MAG: hypothetical protein VYE73_09075 [Acidobacteriota bacterium]|nr:hypothetical protein [Acidobacteriota bacterium]